MSTAPTALSCSASDLELELLDPNGVAFVRLFRHVGGDWDETPTAFRNERVDPPLGHKEAFAVLYMGNNLHAVAVECRLLRCDFQDRYTWSAELSSAYRVARYSFDRPAVFLPIDRRNRGKLGLDGRLRPVNSKPLFQETALTLFRRFGNVVHGLSWESMHRDQPGRIYALWHHHKATIGLAPTTAGEYPSLLLDGEWLEFLAANPDVERLDAFPTS